jgi:hypothetical protein
MQLTQRQCQQLLFKIGMKLGVSPKLISSRLLSIEDKEDIMAGVIDSEYLETAVIVWMNNGMCDYVNDF